MQSQETRQYFKDALNKYKKKNKQICFFVPNPLYKTLKQSLKGTGYSMTQFLNERIKEYLYS